jgi:aspartate/methionine/tyrosine aminotransferase
MSSFSKIFSVPGFRTGFAIASDVVAEKFSLSTSTLISCLPIFTQMGCTAAMGTFKTYTGKVTERCARVTNWCTEALRKSTKIRFTPPRAGFYFFLDISATGMDDLTFSTRLLQEQHTAVTPGSSFGAAYRDFVRIATCGLEEDVREGTQRLINFVGVP